jgi:hypothetical protein
MPLAPGFELIVRVEKLGLKRFRCHGRPHRSPKQGPKPRRAALIDGRRST